MTTSELSATRKASTSDALGVEPVLRVEHVWKLHQLGDEVVKAVIDAELTVMPGEFVCLMGPSGSGKSTLLNMIGGLDRPTKGTIHLDGHDTSTLSESQFAALRHDAIGFIFQSYNLIPFLSAVENVELPLMFEPYDRAALRRRATDLLELVGLSHRVHHQPAKMSGGEQQRTAIARSLVSSPRIVLADEPTANLDQRTGATVVRLLRDLCSQMGTTVVASTHDPVVAAEASRVVRLSDGQIVSDTRNDGASGASGDDGPRGANAPAAIDLTAGSHTAQMPSPPDPSVPRNVSGSSRAHDPSYDVEV